MDHEIIGGQLTLANGTALPLSLAARAGDLIFLSGQLALDDAGKLNGEDIKSQTTQCLANIRHLLAQAGCDLDNVIKATVWLVNRSDFAGFNSVYAEHFPTNPPTRSAVCAELMLPGALVEIEVVAYRNATAG